MNLRRSGIWIVLVATLAVSAWSLWSDGDTGVVAPVARGDRPPAAGKPPLGRRDQAGSRPAAAAPVARPPAPEHFGNLFVAYDYKPPAPPPVAAPAPVPHAPGLPFAFAGRLIIGDQTTFLFLQSGASLEARVGSSVGDFQLVEASQDQLVFLHGPTGDRVPLSIASPAIN